MLSILADRTYRHLFLAQIVALLGTGLTGTVREPFATLISMLNHRRAPILAVDLPSGMDADTGEILGTAVRATRTVSFGAPKLRSRPTL